MSKNQAETLRQTAHQAYGRGDFARALENQIILVNQFCKTEHISANDFSFLGACFFAHGDKRQALIAMREAWAKDKDNLGHRMNLAIIADRLGFANEALEHAEAVAKAAPDNDNAWSLLAHLYPLAGQNKQARQAGIKAMELRDRQGQGNEAPINTPVPSFDYKARERNIIAFSLWGEQEKYLIGAERNAEYARDIYDGWTCRFYVDETVPKATIDKLMACGAQIARCTPRKVAFEGLFWRFHVCDDPGVDRFLIRDADSVVTVQERVAVDEWIASNRHFHVMRDHWTHTELMLAGLWGGVRGALPPILPLINDFLKDRSKKNLPDRSIDQLFLRWKIWPLAKSSLYQHDNYFPFQGAKPFPPLGHRAKGLHVGQDDIIARQKFAPGQSLPAPEFAG